MDLKQAGLGVVLFVVFWAFQTGIFNALGNSAWVLGVIILSAVLWLIGRGVLPAKQEPEVGEIWKFTTIFAVVTTIIVAYLGPYLGAVMPAGFDPAQLTPIVLSFWLIVFGAATFVTGWTMKWGATTVLGVIWLFSSIHFLATGPNSYLHFGLLVGVPFIIYGLISKG